MHSRHFIFGVYAKNKMALSRLTDFGVYAKNKMALSRQTLIEFESP